MCYGFRVGKYKTTDNISMTSNEAVLKKYLISFCLSFNLNFHREGRRKRK